MSYKTCPYCGDGMGSVGTLNHIECVEELIARIAALQEELKHLRSRWDWTEYWFDNLYPNDWERCQAKYDATKTGARPAPERGEP